jgi:hypothetical protein
MFALLAGRLERTRAGSKASPVTNAGPKRLWRKDGQVFHHAAAAGERPAYLEAHASGISER